MLGVSLVSIARSGAVSLGARSAQANGANAGTKSAECNWMEDWWFQSEGGGGDLFYHAGADLGEAGIEAQVKTGAGERGI